MFSGMLAGFLKVAAVAVVTGGFVGGIYWAVQVGGSDGGSAFGQTEPSVTVTITPVPLAPTDTPAPPTPTATALPPTATVPTSPPALAPPPPKPENAAVAEIGTVAGGQWYVLQQCASFYLPGGYTFVIHLALNDPGGFMSVGFQILGTESAVVFHAETAKELGRTVLDSSLGPVFDQIAATISRDC